MNVLITNKKHHFDCGNNHCRVACEYVYSFHASNIIHHSGLKVKAFRQKSLVTRRNHAKTIRLSGMSARSTRAYAPGSSNLRAKYKRLGALLYEHERSDLYVHSNSL